MEYKAPVADIAFTLKHVAGLDRMIADGLYPDLSEDLVQAILTEAGRFAEDVLAPLDRAGDRIGARLENGSVTTPEGFREAWAKWVEAGWGAVTAPPEHGGQGLPILVGTALGEMWNSAAMSFALAPVLSVGAVEALAVHANADLQRIYLKKLVSGEWAGTMNLTEPQAGSDLNAIRTRAERQPDGSYRIFGTKIFITYGEHDLTGNIVHLVLARLPDSPPGTRGISLFLVPKFLADENGNPRRRNDVRCVGIEHKLGIHGSPTCTMAYGEDGGATGWLVGEENRGLAGMFTMMNNARLAVGIQGVSIAERATQKAVQFARERRQGRASGSDETGMSPIIAHPDIRRMLLTMRSLTGAARAICYTCAAAIDRSRHEKDPEKRRQATERANLITPIAKAFSTDIGVEVASLGVQVHGGMGYVEETGAAQLLRDSRIAPIYEGTNGIQAIDLVTRKLSLSDGGAVMAYIAELEHTSERVRASNRADLGRTAERLAEANAVLRETTEWMLAASARNLPEALCGATPYLRLFGLVAGGAGLAEAALADAAEGNGRAGRTLAARFHAENLLPETAALAAMVTGGAAAILAAGESDPVEVFS